MPITIAGSVACPRTGSHPSQMEKIRIAARPTQKVGKAIDQRLTALTSQTKTRRGQMTAAAARPMPRVRPIANALAASASVPGTANQIISATGRSKRMDRPRSPRAAAASQATNCAATPRSSPNSARSAAISESLRSPSAASTSTTSPGMTRIRKNITTAIAHTTAPWRSSEAPDPAKPRVMRPYPAAADRSRGADDRPAARRQA